MSALFPQFLSGIGITVSVFSVSVALGTTAGLCAAIANTSNATAVSAVARGYVNVVRGVPELLIILMVFFGGTAALSAAAGRYVEINAFAAGIGALTVVFGGYAAEIFRGAINAVPRGQTEAAAALGLSRSQTWLLIIIPQMVPLALPAYGNLCISLIKDTALVSIVGLADVMRVAYLGAGSFRAPLPFYLAASAIYLVLTSILLFVFSLLVRRYGQRGARP